MEHLSGTACSRGGQRLVHRWGGGEGGGGGFLLLIPTVAAKGSGNVHTHMRGGGLQSLFSGEEGGLALHSQQGFQNGEIKPETSMGNMGSSKVGSTQVGFQSNQLNFWC